MREVLQVMSSLRTGGLETVAMNCMRYTPRDQYHFTFVISDERVGENEAEVLALGGEIIRIPGPGKGYAAYYRNLYAIMKGGQYDIVHSHIFFASGIVMLAAAAAGVPQRIAHAHSVQRKGSGSVRKRGFYTLMRILLKTFATRFCACSAQAGEYVFSQQAFAQRGMVLPNCIALEKFRYSEDARRRIRRELSIPENAMVIGQVGHLTAAKNQKFLLALFAEIRKEYPDAVLLLVGDGELRDALENRIAQMGMQSHVRLTGTRSDVGALLAAMDVYVCSSTNEGFGISLLEAAASGLDILAEESVLVRELAGRPCFIPMQGFHLEAWKQAAVQSAGRSKDRSAGVSTVSDFDLSHFGELAAKLYT